MQPIPETSTGRALREALRAAWSGLAALTEPDVSRKPSPDQWSAKEILGHLIDSASTNHQRFVRAQTMPDLMGLTYDADSWVMSQCYQDAPWEDLLVLWRFYNLQLARVMESIPETHRTRPRHPHPMAHAGWCPVPEDQPATLEDLMHDYVGHLKHHLKKILG